MRTVHIRNTIIFWTLLLAMAFGQETRRDPTQPSPAFEGRLTAPTTAQSEAPIVRFKLKAIVLSNPDHGLALLETSSGTVTVSLKRGSQSTIMIDQTRYVVKDFSGNSIQIERAGSR